MEMLEACLPLLALVAIIIVNVRFYRSRYGNYPSFEEYKSAHPDKARNNRVSCYSCGGNFLKMRGLYSAVDRRKTHYCVTCGAPLYRSYH